MSPIDTQKKTSGSISRNDGHKKGGGSRRDKITVAPPVAAAVDREQIKTCINQGLLHGC